MVRLFNIFGRSTATATATSKPDIEKATDDIQFLKALVSDGEVCESESQRGNNSMNKTSNNSNSNNNKCLSADQPAESTLKDFVISVINDVNRMENEKSFQNYVRRWKVPAGISPATAARSCKNGCKKGYVFEVEKIGSLKYISTKIM